MRHLITKTTARGDVLYMLPSGEWTRHRGQAYAFATQRTAKAHAAKIPRDKSLVLVEPV